MGNLNRSTALSALFLAGFTAVAMAQQAVPQQGDPARLTDMQLDTVTAGTTLGSATAYGQGLGEGTIADTDANAGADSRRQVRMARATATADAGGDISAETYVATMTYSDSGDGTGAGVIVTASGEALGEGSRSSGRSWSITRNNGRVSVAVGHSHNIVRGGLVRDADATVQTVGDIQLQQSRDVDAQHVSVAHAHGVAIEFNMDIGSAQRVR